MSWFTHATLGRLGTEVCRLGLSASYRPGRRAVFQAADAGVNYFFCFGIDNQMTGALREILPRERQRFVVATGAYNYIWGYQNLKATLEKRLRQLRTDYIDLFHFLGVARASQFGARVRDELAELRADPRVRGISISTHDRKLAGQLAADGTLDGLMVRYNAAHRGAEQDIFPYLAAHDPAMISFTATRWRYLLRRPRAWPRERPVPDASLCYRFVLSNPNVDVCLTAPSNPRQLRANLKALEQGPLAEDEMQFMCEFGDLVHRCAGWFM